MSTSIDFAPLVPWPILWIAAGIAVLLIALLAWRRSRGLPLRVLSILAVLGALANPVVRQEEQHGLSNIVLVATDRSASQTLAGRSERTEAVLGNLSEQLGRISGLEVRRIDTGRDTGGNHGTELFRDIGTALAGIPQDRLAGLLIVTDGQVEDAPKAVAALGIEAPVHALITGAQGEFDRRIEVLKAPRYGLVGSESTAEIAVRTSVDSSAGNVPARLRIRREGQPDLDIVAQPNESVRVPMGFPHARTNIVEVELAPVDGELTSANNRVVLAAEGVRENLRVLLVSGEPHAGERTWRNLLKSDASVDLVHFTILRPPQKQDGTPINELSLIAFPTRELFSEKIDGFDLIIFDRYASHGILPSIYIDNIARYVEEKGGAVLVVAGEDYATNASLFNTPLAQVLPAEPTGNVTEAPYKPHLTDDGAKHPVTAGLPGSEGKDPTWGQWFRTVDVTNTSGRTLMSGAGDKPLLVLDHRGKGRVALMLSDQAWLWARGYDGGGPYEPLLRRLAHWLMKEPELEEEQLSAKAEAGKLTITRRSMGATVPPVTAIAPSGARSEVQLSPSGPGVWQGTLTAAEQGFYKVTSGNLSSVALAGSQNGREMAEVTATAAKLQPLADTSGGGVFWTAATPGAPPTSPVVPRVSMLASAQLLHGSDWLGLRDRRAHVVTGVSLTPVLTGLAGLCLLLGLASLAWWREGR